MGNVQIDFQNRAPYIVSLLEMFHNIFTDGVEPIIVLGLYDFKSFELILK